MKTGLPPRRTCRLFGLAASLLALALSLATPGPAQTAVAIKQIPVILTTDIGSDIDDTWALGFLLKSPELDLKLAISDYGRPEYRTKLIAKFLERAGRGDIPVGLGVDTVKSPSPANQAAWVEDYELAKYPGKVHRDGVQAMIALGAFEDLLVARLTGEGSTTGGRPVEVRNAGSGHP